MPNGKGVVYGNPTDMSIQRAAVYLRQKSLVYVPITIHQTGAGKFSSSAFQWIDGEINRLNSVEQIGQGE
jgi:hypothetical protein